MKPLFGLAVALWLTGCGDPIHPQQVIEKPRVIGARAEVQGDVDRATPDPGEAAAIRWLVVDPFGSPDFGFSLVACEPSPVATGVSRCGADPFATGFARPGGEELPTLVFTLPADYLASTILVAGVVCFGGIVPDTATLLADWPLVTRCGSERAQAVTFEVTVARDGTTNRNPRLASDALELDGKSWLPVDNAADDSCLDPRGRPQVSAGARAVTISYLAEDAHRETLIDGSKESLLVAGFSDEGQLERTFSIIEGEAPSGPVDIEWSPPAALPSDGRLVRFYFVLRDDRGGTDWTERSLCLIP
jgi:hypothetical protein